jgi:hypothetical protein
VTDRPLRLAELSAHRANVQDGEIVLISAVIGFEGRARATAEATWSPAQIRSEVAPGE